MTQVEIAKKILEQKGGCIDIFCRFDGCMFAGRCSTEKLTNEDVLEETKQWLKEQEKEMIDLTKNQIVTTILKGYFDNGSIKPKGYGRLLSIDHRVPAPYMCMFELDVINYLSYLIS